jgi:hypothetical protein
MIRFCIMILVLFIWIAQLFIFDVLKQIHGDLLDLRAKQEQRQ